MADLIYRDALLKDLRSECPESDVCFSHEPCIDCIVKRQPAVNRWIPCSERLPEAGMPVLIYACKHRVTAYYDNCKNLFRLTENDNLYYIAEYVTHWMPLPSTEGLT